MTGEAVFETCNDISVPKRLFSAYRGSVEPRSAMKEVNKTISGIVNVRVFPWHIIFWHIRKNKKYFGIQEK